MKAMNSKMKKEGNAVVRDMAGEHMEDDAMKKILKEVSPNQNTQQPQKGKGTKRHLVDLKLRQAEVSREASNWKPQKRNHGPMSERQRLQYHVGEHSAWLLHNMNFLDELAILWEAKLVDLRVNGRCQVDNRLLWRSRSRRRISFSLL